MNQPDSPMSVSADRPEKVPSPRVHVRRLCDRIDRLLSLDHNPARKASEEYDDAFHDAVHAIRSLYRYTDLLPTSPAADRPVENSELREEPPEPSRAYLRVGAVRPHPNGIQPTGGKAEALSRRGDREALTELLEALRECDPGTPGDIDITGRIEELFASQEQRRLADIEAIIITYSREISRLRAIGEVR